MAVEDYWSWRPKAVALLSDIRQKLDQLTQGAVALRSSAAGLSSEAQTKLPGLGLNLWTVNKDANATLRVGERRLALLGYESELALSRQYFSKIAAGALDRVQSGLGPGSGQQPYKFDLRVFFDSSDPCVNGVPLNPDRIGAVLTLSRATSTYDVSFELALHFTTDGVLLTPTRSAAICSAVNPNAIEQDEIEKQVNQFLWDATNWSLLPITVPNNSMTEWAPYMEIVGSNVSVLSKSQHGRHPTPALVEEVPSGWDFTISASIVSVTAAVQTAIADANNSSDFHPQPYSDMSAHLDPGGPHFVPPAIEFVVQVYSKDQGGDIPAEEWHLDQAGKVKIQAVFVNDGGGKGHFALSQLGDIYDTSVSFCWTYTGVCVSPPDFVKDFIARFFNTQISTLNDVPVDFGDAESIGCEVRADRVVFFVKMPDQNQQQPSSQTTRRPNQTNDGHGSAFVWS